MRAKESQNCTQISPVIHPPLSEHHPLSLGSQWASALAEENEWRSASLVVVVNPAWCACKKKTKEKRLCRGVFIVTDIVIVAFFHCSVIFLVQCGPDQVCNPAVIEKHEHLPTAMYKVQLWVCVSVEIFFPFPTLWETRLCINSARICECCCLYDKHWIGMS